MCMANYSLNVFSILGANSVQLSRFSSEVLNVPTPIGTYTFSAASNFLRTYAVDTGAGFFPTVFGRCTFNSPIGN